MVVCLVATLGVTAANLRLTYVTDSNGAKQVILTSATDPAKVMSLSGIQSEEGDQVYYTAFSGNLATLNIERAFSVNVQADGQTYPVKMVYGTVADALQRAGITLEGDDYTEPALDRLVTAGTPIVVHRVDYQDRVETQAIPYDTEYVYTSLYFRNTGRTTTVQHGAEGQQTVTTRDRYVDGELENSIVVDSTTTVQPTNHVIKTYGAGAPVSPLTGPDGTTNAPASYSKVLTGKATGYYSTPCLPAHSAALPGPAGAGPCGGLAGRARALPRRAKADPHRGGCRTAGAGGCPAAGCASLLRPAAPAVRLPLGPGDLPPAARRGPGADCP